jgi:hypothetical protein
MKILVIPDGQNKPGIDLTFWKYVGQFWADKKPDVVVNLGDWADMPSLSSYDKGTKSFEGRRYTKDIQAAKDAMEILLAPVRAYQQSLVDHHRPRYKPRMILTLGNHEERIERAINYQAELEGLISYDDLEYEKAGWEVIPYLKPITIEGINFCHYFYNPYSGKPYGGTIDNILKQVGKSFVQGHKQGLFMGTRHLPTGECQWGIVAGSCYEHDEDYKGPQANNHFRGILMLHNVQGGTFDPMVVSLDYLRARYEAGAN